jgi:cell division septation protein DedD
MASLLDDVTPEVQTPAAHVLSDKELRAARLVAKKKADEKTRLDAEAKAKADAERAAEAEKRAAARQNPAREWVQVATGNNRAGFGHTWAKLKDGHAALLSGKSAYFAPVNHTYRILVGPFADADDARALAKKLQNAGLAVHTFSSEAGQEVARIGGRTRSANEDASRDEKPARKRHKTRASVDGSADTGSADTAHKSGRGDVTAPSGDEPKRKRRRR